MFRDMWLEPDSPTKFMHNGNLTTMFGNPNDNPQLLGWSTVYLPYAPDLRRYAWRWYTGPITVNALDIKTATIVPAKKF